MSNTKLETKNPDVKGKNDRELSLENGYEPVPIIGKAPKWDDWQDGEITVERLANVMRQHPEFTNTGLRTGQLCVFDIDTPDTAHTALIQKAIESVLGETVLQRFGSKGIALCYYNATPIRKATLYFRPPGADPKVKPLKVEVLGQGNQMAAFGQHPDTSRDFAWLGVGDPTDTPLTSLPEVTPDLIEKALTAARNALDVVGFTDLTMSGQFKDAAAPLPADNDNSEGDKPVDLSQMWAMLDKLDPDMDREGWRNIGMALKDARIWADDGRKRYLHEWERRELWDEWSAKGGEKYQGTDEIDYQWASFKRTEGARIKIGTLVQMARDAGYAGGVHRDNLAATADLITDPPADDTTPPKVDDRIAQIFATARGGSGKGAIIAYKGVDDFLARPGRKRKFICPMWLPAQGSAFILARRGVGKTKVAVDLCLRIACGMNWHQQWPLAKGWVVVCLIGEDVEGFEAMIEGWTLQHGRKPDPDRFIVYSTAVGAPAVPDLLTPATVSNGHAPSGSKSVTVR